MAALADDDMSEGTEEFSLQLVTGNVAIVAGGSASVMIQNGIFGDLNPVFRTCSDKIILQ